MTAVGKWVLGAAIAAAIASVGWSYKATYEAGGQAGKLACESTQAKSNEKQQIKADKKTKSDLKRADAAGNAQEKGRAAVVHVFDQLAKDSLNEVADPVDSCVLPDPRLRRWNAANAGRLDTADQGRPASQPDAAASAPTGSEQREGARSGGKPPGGDQGLPPAGDADVQPAGLSGGQP